MNAYPCSSNSFQVPASTANRRLWPKLPIVQNGPPGTAIVFADGTKVPLPTDQIVFAEDGGGRRPCGFRRDECRRNGKRPAGLLPGS